MSLSLFLNLSMPLILKSVDLIAVLAEVISEDLCLVFRLDIGGRGREADRSMEQLLTLNTTIILRRKPLLSSPSTQILRLRYQYSQKEWDGLPLIA